MAGILTISKGHDASYPWKQIGTDTSGTSRNSHAGVGYYLSPAERGGEPPGIWTGRGVTELGLRLGATVDRSMFEPLYGRHVDPRDPSGETLLGRAPGRYKPAEEIYAAMLAAEPSAMAERREQLMVEAKAQVRTADLYWDATFSVSKSVSLFHASALANAAAADRQADLEAAAAWERLADDIWAAIMEGNAAALEYLQREAGQTRAGYHPGGRWEDAREWVIASFRQHTSRDGDPQLHVHNLILHKVRRESDGAWRALDSMSLYRHRPAASAIAALAMENALTRRFGVRWVQRRDGHGREIAEVGQALMDMFSSRRASIGPLTLRLAQEYEAQFGRAPDARALASLRQWANHATRRAKDAEPLDLGALVQRWSAQAVAAEAGALEPLGPSLLRSGARARHRAPGAELAETTRQGTAPQPQQPAPADSRQRSTPLTAAQAQRLMAEAVAAVQQAQPTFTEADLIRHLGERLPAQVGVTSAQDAAELLPALARQALAGQAIMLSAPEWPRVPDCLRRASGESLYVPHGAARYTTGAQLDLEARLLSDAQDTGAPRLNAATAAQLLGAEQAHLEAQLHQASDGALNRDDVSPAGSTLRPDQAAAAFWALTSARRAEVLVGPAGSGKTWTVAEMARIWRQAEMGEVIGLATSQTAANILADAGVTRAFNTARFLGHLEGRREALGAMPVAPGSLIILDEASMMSLADIAAILAIARRTGSKVVVTGDHEQLAAVEGGGAMMLLARRLGYVQLAEPQRFASEWERDATLRLRAGDVTVLTEYQENGRLRGGTAEEATEQAYRGWLADYLAGMDSVLIARTEDQARELSRRARDDLIRYGPVAAGAPVRLAAGEHASAGDLITARRNNRAISAGRDGRDLANRDILQITDTAAGQGGNRVEVRRLLDRDPASGQSSWSAPFWLPRRYLASHATLAYATTAHAALGRTTDTAHALADGLADRRALYVAMSRGRIANYAYCITHSARLADIAAGTRRAPELNRAIRLDAERAGVPAGANAAPAADHGEDGPVLDQVTVLAGIMTRHGGELSATETLEQELARADHLGVLGGIWDDVVRREQRTRFERELCAALPDDVADQALGDPALTWLWRTLREAECAGLDGGQVLQHAVVARSMTGARDVARVLDSRVRRTLTGVRPQPPGRWAEQVPGTCSAEMKRYLHELAEAMDDRTRRLGEHAALTQPLWARQALGPVRGNPAARLDWEQRASVIAAYRERYGHSHPADPIGPEPAKASPEARAAWHGALAAAGRIDGIDLRHCTDGELWLRRGAYERETAWAPPHVTRELELVHTAGRDAHVNVVRAEHEARSSRSQQTAARHRELARRWRAVEAKAAAETRMLADVRDTRRQWEHVTQSTRRVAIAADTELRRRHPGQPIAALRPHPAEEAAAMWPEHVDNAGPTAQSTPGSTSSRSGTHAGRGCRPSAPVVRPDDDRLAALGLTLDAADAEIPAELRRISQNAATTQSQLDELAGLRMPEKDGELSPELAWPEQARRERNAVLQQAEADIAPSARVLTSYEEARTGAPHAEPEREAG